MDTPNASAAPPPWFDSASYLSLATDRKDGREVRTPVWFARTPSGLVLFSVREAGKVKRIRRTRAGRVAPCDVRGKVLGEWVPVRGELLDDPAGVAEAHAALRRKYGLMMWAADVGAWLRGRLRARQYIRLQA